MTNEEIYEEITNRKSFSNSSKATFDSLCKAVCGTDNSLSKNDIIHTVYIKLVEIENLTTGLLITSSINCIRNMLKSSSRKSNPNSSKNSPYDGVGPIMMKPMSESFDTTLYEDTIPALIAKDRTMLSLYKRAVVYFMLALDGTNVRHGRLGIKGLFYTTKENPYKCRVKTEKVLTDLVIMLYFRFADSLSDEITDMVHKIMENRSMYFYKIGEPKTINAKRYKLSMEAFKEIITVLKTL